MAEFYSARGWEIPPLPWTNLSPPLSFAEAKTEEINVDGVEIVSARWFDRKTILSMLAGNEIAGVRLPRPIAIAYHLIKSWAEG